MAWDEDSSSSVTGFAVTVDGVRTDYGATPQQPDGSCSCSIPLPFSSGRHTVVVSAYNSFGETASDPLIVGPTADAGGTYSGQAGSPLSVSGAGSIDGTGTITSYAWQWGDGTADTSSSIATASHAYAVAGTYTITLTVTDDFPASHSATTLASITAAPPPPPQTPTSPNPADRSSGIDTRPTLTWIATGATSYDVSFGTTNPPPLVATAQPTASFTPAALAVSTSYFWQIVAHNSVGATPGPVWSFTTAAPSSSGDIVIYAADVPTTALHGVWSQASDPTSPNGIKLATPDNGWALTVAPAASPADYVDVTFSATAGTPYTVWLRLQALANSKWNDSLWVQFSDALANGGPIYPIGTTSGLLVNLATDATASSIQGWGWQNAAYWFDQPTTVTFATSGAHTLRIQVREDGVAFDQIVLSPGTYLHAPPGPVSNDSTIVPKAGLPGAPIAPTPANSSTGVSRTPTLTWTATSATSYDVSFGVTNPPPSVATAQATASYSPAALAAGTSYFWQIVAHNDAGATPGPVWSFTTSPAAPPSGDVVIYATDIPTTGVHGVWSESGDPTSPSGIKLATPDNGWSSTVAPVASPADYVDVTFNATAGTPYTIWLRLQALANSKFNDSLWVQFSDALANGGPVYPIGTTSGLLVNLATDAIASSIQGWGWQNAAYWFGQPTTVTFATTGSHTLRIQVREDGVAFDQIVLSPSTYLHAAPGAVSNDSTIVPKP